MKKIATNEQEQLQNENIRCDVICETKRKRLVIGDIHGHIEPFKTIYEHEDPDDVIILGDYFDSFHGTDDEIINCFKEILEMKKNHTKGEFILLIGNHDFHYMDLTETYSGKRKSYEIAVSVMLDKCLENKQLQYYYIDQVNKTVYSHAGIMNAWLNENRLFISNLEDLQDIDPRKYRFTFRGGDSGYGDGPFASPIWVRPKTLLNDMYVDMYGSKWTQIVGHTNGIAKTYLADETMLKGANKYEYNSIEDEVNAPILYVIDSMPNYYIVEMLEGDFIKSREVKCVNDNRGLLDKLANNQTIINSGIRKQQDIKKLAESFGIQFSTPI